MPIYNEERFRIDNKYDVTTIDEIKRSLRVNPGQRDLIKGSILELFLNSPNYLQKLIPNMYALQRLIEIFPEQHALLLAHTLKNPHFINTIDSFPFARNDKNTFTKLLAAFPQDKKLILETLFGDETWLNATLRSHFSLWRLIKLITLYPDYKNILSNTAFSEKNTFLLPNVTALQANTAYKDLSPTAFFEKFLTTHCATFLKDIDIDREEDLLELIKLFPEHANILFDHAVTNDKFLKSIKIAYRQVDTIEELLPFLTSKSKTEIFEKLFGQPGALLDIISGRDPSSHSFKADVYKKLLTIFPKSRDRMFELLFTEPGPKLGLTTKELINLIETYPHAKQFFYYHYLANAEDFNSYIINTKELVKLMKLYPEHGISFLEQAFTNKTFITWRGFREGFGSFEWYDQNYIALQFHKNPALGESIFNKVFGTELLMNNFCYGKPPQHLIDDLDLLVKYFPAHSKEIFQLTFPNPEVLEKRLVFYDEYAPKLANVFPNIRGIREGNVFNANNEIESINNDGKKEQLAPAKEKANAKIYHLSSAKNIFTHFSHTSKKLISEATRKAQEKIDTVCDVISFKK